MRRRLAVIAAVLGASLALVSPANAYWVWGPNWLAPGVSAGPCIWYWSQATCSGWNYWDLADVNHHSGGEVLLGFENNARIRGIIASGYGVTSHVWADDLGMGGYILAHDTSWSTFGPPYAAYITTHAYA
jgi:hypothetical protein